MSGVFLKMSVVGHLLMTGVSGAISIKGTITEWTLSGYTHCAFCGKDMRNIRHWHVMVDGEDCDVCSFLCIRKYSKKHPIEHITVIEPIEIPKEKVLLT